jgi:hypothetical protein
MGNALKEKEQNLTTSQELGTQLKTIKEEGINEECGKTHVIEERGPRPNWIKK